MIKIALKHFLGDTALSVFFDMLQKNLVTNSLHPIIDGRNIKIDTPYYLLEILNVGGDTKECISLGKDIVAHVIYMDANKIVSYLKDTYDLESHIIFK